MKAFKIVVTGPFNAGKTTLIKTLCGRILQSDKRLLVETVKPTTTVALDFGLLELDQKRIRLFGTPGQRRFSFMWRVLAAGMDGYIMMVDSRDANSLEDAAHIYKIFREGFPDTPHVISANKADGERLVSKETIRLVLKPPENVPIRYTVAIRRESALEILRLLMGLIEGRKPP